MCVLTSPFLASAFRTHSVARRGLLLICFPLAREIVAYCVGAVSTRYRLNRATKYEYSFRTIKRVLISFYYCSCTIASVGLVYKVLLLICVWESTPKSMASHLRTGMRLLAL
jgi:hypothetical protein